MNTLLVNLPYAYVALSLMIAEANHALKELGIPMWRPISAHDVASYYIHPPRLWTGGNFETTNHFFGFGKDGRLQFITRVDPERDLSIEARYEMWTKMKSTVGTNEAYQLATNWLTRLEVDVPALEKAFKHTVSQAFFYAEEASRTASVGRRIVMLPRFEVKWGTNDASPAVWVSIFGPTKEPIHIRQEDVSFSKRPKGLVKDLERLLAIPNQEFARYSTAEKSNLVVQSAVAQYRRLSLPEVVKATNFPAWKSKPVAGEIKQPAPSSMAVGRDRTPP